MTTIFARRALLADGWHTNVALEVGDGSIARITPAAAGDDADVVTGVAIPGLCNAHSHAFQRAMAGHAEQRGPDDQDNFWSWRERMYGLAGRIDAPRLAAIARQAYSEMLESGFTAVAEFHYLHSEPGAGPSEAMFEALCEAAVDTGIRLTYVPVLYERGGFGDEALSARQRRFALPLPEFLAHYRRCRERAAGSVHVGIGAHSLRAVTAASLAAIAEQSAVDGVPLHIHIAEQQREVEQSLAVRHRRPVRWLLEQHALDERWCLVHATHVDAEEVAALAETGAVVCLCPSTEANLGDGLFPLARYLEQGGRIAIGSDSHISINPFEELRWLEYGQRLVAERRNIAAIGTRHTGRSLFERVATGGALAGGTATGSLAPGMAADLLCLDDEDPMLAGHGVDTMLDALVFSGFSLPLDRVMVAGRWRVVDGRHAGREQAREQFRAAVAAVSAALAEPSA